MFASCFLFCWNKGAAVQRRLAEQWAETRKKQTANCAWYDGGGGNWCEFFRGSGWLGRTGTGEWDGIMNHSETGRRPRKGKIPSHEWARLGGVCRMCASLGHLATNKGGQRVSGLDVRCAAPKKRMQRMTGCSKEIRRGFVLSGIPTTNPKVAPVVEGNEETGKTLKNMVCRRDLETKFALSDDETLRLYSAIPTWSRPAAHCIAHFQMVWLVPNTGLSSIAYIQRHWWLLLCTF